MHHKSKNKSKSSKKKKRYRNIMNDNFPYVIGGSLALALAYGAYMDDGPRSDLDPIEKCKRVTNYKAYNYYDNNYILKKFLNDNDYKVYDVNADGACFFHAVSVAMLHKTKIYIESQDLRKMAVDNAVDIFRHGIFMDDNDNAISVDAWKNSMLGKYRYADASVVMGMANLLKKLYGLNLVIYYADGDSFKRYNGNNEKLKLVNSPSKYIDNNIYILYNGINHYMAVAGPLESYGFGTARKLHRRSRKRQKL
jgi:hypothetical protein